MTQVGCDHPARELLDWYVNGTLGAVDAETVREHLDLCAVCSEETAELESVAQALTARDVRAGTPSTSPARPSIGTRIAYAAAAALALPAMLGLYWVYLGLPTPPGASSTPDQTVVTLDLGGGPSRDTGELPTFTVSGAGRNIVLRIAVPIGEAPRHVFDLIGPGDRTLVGGAPLTEMDSMGNYRANVPAGAIAAPGDYLVVIREVAGEGGGQTFRYPFRVE